MRLVLISEHAKESAVDLGINMPDNNFKFLVENRIRRDLDRAIKVRQGNEDRWIIPLKLPPSVFCDEICCWMVLSTPNDSATKEKYQYVLKTFLHENNPIVRAYWHHEEAESPVIAYLNYCAEMKRLE